LHAFVPDSQKRCAFARGSSLALGGSELSILPEVLRNPSRGYIFVEAASHYAFRQMFKTFGDAYVGPMPSAGGMMNDELELQWGSRKFFLVSFGKDLVGWTKLIKGHCAVKQLAYIECREQSFLLNGVVEVSSDACHLAQH
jgi:hypothetical protein